MIHKGRMRNICGCCNLGRQAKKMDVPWTVALRHVQVGTKETNESLKFFFLELSEPKKRDLHPLALTGRTGQTVLMPFLSPPLWLVALFWLFVKCSFLLVHVPRL